MMHLVAQTVTILMFCGWIALLAIRLRKQKYGYWYIFMRLVFYKDGQPLKWLWEHRIFIYYIGQIISLLFINIGLIEQIKTNMVYEKPWPILVGNIMLSMWVVLSIRYLSKKQEN